MTVKCMLFSPRDVIGREKFVDTTVSNDVMGNNQTSYCYQSQTTLASFPGSPLVGARGEPGNEVKTT